MRSLIKSGIFVTSICLMIVITSILNFTNPSKAKELNKIDIITAKKVAFTQVVSDMKMNKKNSWNLGVKFGESTILYDINDKPSAYLFRIIDQKNSPNGYIIIGASKDGPAIIEYSYRGKPFIDKGLDTLKRNFHTLHSPKVHYLGELEYVVSLEQQTKKTYYDISTFNELNRNLIEVTIKKNYKPVYTKNQVAEYNNIWSDLLIHCYSNPPILGNDPITDPDKYESGFTSSNYDDIDYYDKYYTTTDDNIDPDNCSPTAATNVCVYWYNRDKDKYNSLYKNYEWEDTYKEFYKLMETNEDKNGTYEEDIPSAYEEYFKDSNICCDVIFDDNVSWDDVKSEITTGDRPFHYNVIRHYLYSNHSVVGFGYKVYKYSNVYVSRYVRIADGWEHYADRFIHFTIGLSRKSMVKLVIQ